MNNRFYRRTMSVMLSAVLFVGAVGYAARADIESEKNDLSALEQEKINVQNFINGLQIDIANTEENIRALDEQLGTVTTNLFNTTKELSSVEKKIDKNEKKLKAAKKSIKEQYASMKLRIQFMYENGNQQMLDLVLSSDNIADFLNKADYISELSSYDRKMLNKMKKTKKTIEDTQATLVEQKNTLTELKESQEQQKADIESLVTAKQEQLATYNSQIASSQTTLDELDIAIGDKQAVIAEMESIEAERALQRQREQESREKESREKAIRDQANQQSPDTQQGGDYEAPTQAAQPVTGGGSYGWPLPGYSSVSSGYGYRSDPFTGETTYHSGIDLPAPAGTAIVAANSGQVAWATYSTTAGNWIGIDHGNGVYTVYMHMSALMVSAGQNVSQGQTIGLVGTTGSSTGNHLHFSVRVNGAYVDPWNYLR